MHKGKIASKMGRLYFSSSLNPKEMPHPMDRAQNKVV
jgi:hypothetical protein